MRIEILSLKIWGSLELIYRDLETLEEEYIDLESALYPEEIPGAIEAWPMERIASYLSEVLETAVSIEEAGETAE